MECGKEHNHDERYALIDHTHSEFNDTVAFRNQTDFHSQAIFHMELGLTDWETTGAATEDDKVWLHCESDNSGALRIEKNDGQAHTLAPLHCADITAEGNITCSTVNGINISTIKEEMFDMMYPVGTVYLSYNGSLPTLGSEIRGEWELIEEGRFLRSARDESGQGEQTGGSETHSHTTGDCTLTVSQIPSHSHAQYVTANSSGSALRRDYDGDGSCQPYAQGVNTGTTGGSQPHNHGSTSTESNLPPYFTVYMYKRVA